MVLRTVTNFTLKRVPLIRFRAGGLPFDSIKNQDASQADPKANATQHQPEAIEDWELPQRYWRKSLTEEEIDYINRGGPD